VALLSDAAPVTGQVLRFDGTRLIAYEAMKLSERAEERERWSAEELARASLNLDGAALVS
jgi:hypothetical protein